ncbi:hypothetical protein CEUSTIGMA_g7473.t1 [Chlamydomonas eustigma]|uniref:ABC transporter domain-containing protein n=1 Tax=Chlamydomonas eustigma TaxID=1157962 RepID=A0A250XAE9_9CHLO|nr:hypothetical protein CEUSTIGMA_g7473.t1 [Chlamydomonas eustigma]|eukprot:GAX80034.1 hypothetical protein CEUSTIGMA_g7473.t1 [Chlamydomonas eustigma]
MRVKSAWGRAWHWLQIESPDNTSDDVKSRAALRPLLKELWKLCSGEKALLFGAVLFMVAAATAELAIPHFATTSIFAAGAPGAHLTSAQQSIQILIALVCFYSFAAAVRGALFGILNNKMTLRLRSKLFLTLIQSETAFFDANEVGTLTSRLQSDCQAMTKCISSNMNIAVRNTIQALEPGCVTPFRPCVTPFRTLVCHTIQAMRNTIQALGGFAYLWFLSKELCIATMCIITVLWAVTLAYGEFARKMQKVHQDVLACSNQVAEEVLSQSRIVRTFGTEGQESKRYNGWLGYLYQVGLRQTAGYSAYVVSSHAACYASKVVAVLLGCTMVVKGALTAEQLTNFIFYVEFVVYSSLNVCDQYTEFMEAVGASERVIQLLEAKPARQIESGLEPSHFSGRVELQDVHFRYPSRPDESALRGLSLSFPPGRVVAIVGPSGSGKSSIVALLQRLYDPSEGVMLLDGVDLKQVDATWYRKQIGVVSQEPRLFGATVASNIAYGLSDDDRPENNANSLSDDDRPENNVNSLSDDDRPENNVNSLSGGMEEEDCSTSTADCSVNSSELYQYMEVTPLLPLRTSTHPDLHSMPTSSSPNHEQEEDSAARHAEDSKQINSSALGCESLRTLLPDRHQGVKELASSALNGSSMPDLKASHGERLSLEDYLKDTELPVMAGRQEDIEAAARQANAHEFIMALPNGYNTLVTDKLLSGGQKQRIALARALVRKPRILVLDEATSALDAESEAQVQAALDEVMIERKDCTVVVIAHRLATVREADLIYVLDKGKVSESGCHQTLMEKEGLYWQMVQRQNKGHLGTSKSMEYFAVSGSTPRRASLHPSKAKKSATSHKVEAHENVDHNYHNKSSVCEEGSRHSVSDAIESQRL